jgi:hypothetical protein
METFSEAVKGWWQFAVYFTAALFTGAVGGVTAHQKVNRLKERIANLEINSMIKGECGNQQTSCQKFNAAEFNRIHLRIQEIKEDLDKYHNDSKVDHDCLVKVLLEWRKEALRDKD